MFAFAVSEDMIRSEGGGVLPSGVNWMSATELLLYWTVPDIYPAEIIW